MKQTAVEWLLNELFNNKGLKKEQGVVCIKLKLVQQAKEMEKKQIIDAFDNGYFDYKIGAEHYYNETFKSE